QIADPAYSNATGRLPTAKVPDTTPSFTLTLVTESLYCIATHMYVPSNATASGPVVLGADAVAVPPSSIATTPSPPTARPLAPPPLVAVPLPRVISLIGCAL